MSAGALSLDPASITVEQLWDDPYPVYEALREQAPVCHVPAVGLWFVTRWEDVEAAAMDAVRFPAAVPGSPLDRTLGGRNVLTTDGTEQRRLRAPLEPTLRPRAVEQTAPATVERMAGELLDGFQERGSAELMSEYLEPLSVLSLARLIGLGDDLDAPTLVRWFAGLVSGTSNFEGDASKQAVADATAAEISERLRPLLAQVLDRPDGTLVSDMLHSVEGDLDQRMEAVMPTLLLVLIGGLQEPGHGAAATLLGLLSNPDQAAVFAADPARLARDAVEEGLRWTSPIGTQTRTATAGVRLAGVELPEGCAVALVVASANRDPRVWGEDADAYRLSRPRRPNGAFGFGPHFCVGHHLARVQDRIAVRMAFERLPGLRLDPERPPRVRGWEYRAPAHLDAVWD
jgi:cytochrome P450